MVKKKNGFSMSLYSSKRISFSVIENVAYVLNPETASSHWGIFTILSNHTHGAHFHNVRYNLRDAFEK